MGGPVWVMFLSDKTTTEEFLMNTYVPFNCKFITAKTILAQQTVKLYQSYRVSPDHPLRVSDYGIWTPEDGLVLAHLTPTYFYRNDLEGLLFRVGSLQVSIKCCTS